MEGLRLESNEPLLSESCQEFYRQWSNLVSQELAPHTRDFLTNPDPSLISNVYVLEVTELGPLIRFMGTGLVELRGKDMTNTIFGAGLPQEQLDGLVRNCASVTGHPCGLAEVAEFSTSTGRSMRMETVMLPLMVDDGRASRLCTFSQVLESPRDEDLAELRFKSGKKVIWIDIGAGVPANTPATDRKP